MQTLTELFVAYAVGFGLIRLTHITLVYLFGDMEDT